MAGLRSVQKQISRRHEPREVANKCPERPYLDIHIAQDRLEVQWVVIEATSRDQGK